MIWGGKKEEEEEEDEEENEGGFYIYINYFSSLTHFLVGQVFKVITFSAIPNENKSRSQPLPPGGKKGEKRSS